MVDFLLEAMSAASGEEFDEIPVGIREFVESPDYISAEKPYKLSEYQYQLVEAMSQIYRYPTLVHLHGEAKAQKIWNTTYREIVMQLGKGSGKDFTSTIAVAYVVYLCLCLKNPTKYFANASIDIINVAINADQAQRVFFKNFMTIIKECAWFTLDKYDDKQNYVEFNKSVNVYSGHSEREAYEGYNTLMIILDEISGFALENTSGNQKAKTGPEIYDWARGSVTSRFSEMGKVVLLSFPRFRNDFIQQKYDEVILEKETINRQADVKINPDLGDEFDEQNNVHIEWDEDHIIRYRYPFTFALKRPSWEVNPNKSLQVDYALDFFRNYADALGRFACMPSDNSEDAFFKDKVAIENSFITQNGVDTNGVFHVNFMPKPDKEYYLHVDLSKVHDRCAIALAHVDKWVVNEMNYAKETVPVVRVDALRWWKPEKDKPMDYKEVTKYILALRSRGFNIKLCTFDRWNSHDTMNFLESRGVPTDLLSVDVKHYDDFLSVMYDERLIGPKSPELVTELRELMWIKGKIDHPRTGYKDLSDAVCGAIFNSIAHTSKPNSRVVEVVSYKSLARDESRQAAKKALKEQDGMIRAPKKMPDDIVADYDNISLSAIRLI